MKFKLFKLFKQLFVLFFLLFVFFFIILSGSIMLFFFFIFSWSICIYLFLAFWNIQQILVLLFTGTVMSKFAFSFELFFRFTLSCNVVLAAFAIFDIYTVNMRFKTFISHFTSVHNEIRARSSLWILWLSRYVFPRLYWFFFPFIFIGCWLVLIVFSWLVFIVFSWFVFILFSCPLFFRSLIWFRNFFKSNLKLNWAKLHAMRLFDSKWAREFRFKSYTSLLSLIYGRWKLDFCDLSKFTE